MESLFQDLRYAVRMILKSPVLSGLAILSLGLGIGANTTIFSFTNALLLQSLPVTEPERLLAIYTTDKKNPGFNPLSHLNWKDYRKDADLFEGFLGYDFVGMSLNAGAEPEIVTGQLVSGNYFDLLGIRALVGRTFGPREDEVPGRDPVVVLSHGFWTKKFGADPQAVGRTLKLNGASYTIVGVTPNNFTGLDVGIRPEVWVPMAMNRQVRAGINWYEERRGLFLFTVGRLKPGASPTQALAQLTTIADRLEKEYPNDNKSRSVTVVPLAQATINPNARQGVVAATALLMTIVGLVLLIACANVSNLLLGRALQRRREIAVRLAIGANRRRLVRQLLTESIALAVPSAALGILIAYWARGALLSLLPPLPGVSLSLQLDLDWRVLGFTMLVGLGAGVLFGLVPALQASKPDVVEALKDQDRTGGVARHRLGIRDFLVVSQVALSLVALVGAGLFLRSLDATRKTDPGFETNKLLSVSFDLDLQGYSPEKGEAFFRQLVDRMMALPGVVSASYASAPPLSFTLARSVFLEGGNDNDRTLVNVNTVGPRYFETMGIPLVKGRPLDEDDKAGGPKAVVINETMARKFWPNGDALGKRFRFFGQDEPWAEIVGIAKQAKYTFLGEDPQSYIYEAHAQRYSGARTLLVRTATDPTPLLVPVERELKTMDHDLPLLALATISKSMNDSFGLQAQRAGASLLGLFGLLALVLAAVGIYSVMSYSVGQRQREIGIRMALGARRLDVLKMILGRGMAVVGVGLALGLAISLTLSRLAANMLVGISPWDVASFAGAALVLAVVSFIANVFPTRRAAGIDPTVALRYQ
jgi:macrolide transport system ATP-binding/permease protein